MMKRGNSGMSLNSGPQNIIKKNTSTIGSSNLSSLPISMETNGPVVEHWAHTQSKLFNINFTWRINNFSFRQEKTGDWLESPKFSLADVNDKIQWCLRLYPKGRNEECNEYLYIFLRLASKPCAATKVLGKFKFSILNPDINKTLKSKFSDVLEYEYNRFWGYPLLVKRAFLMEKGFLPEDELTIVCEVSFVSESIDTSSQEIVGQFKMPEWKLTDDLGYLLGSQKFCDVTLVVGEYELPAHKAILAARSDVFAAMFEHEMKERTSGRVTITDVNREVLQEILSFIYTEEVPKLKEMANNLLAAADKYALTKLKVMSEEALFSKLSIETAVETLVLADIHSAKQLKALTIQFISLHAKDIMKTKEWQNMIKTNDHPSLIAETLDALFTQPK